MHEVMTAQHDDEEGVAGAFLPELKRLTRLSKRARPTERPTRLPLVQICESPAFFQARSRRVAQGHAQKLAGVLRQNAPGRQELEPIIVMWVGSDAYVVDGHHRLWAYRAVIPKASVPVYWFEGSLAQALAEAGRGNSRDKLPMSSSEKMELAWRLVYCGGAELSKRDISDAAGVSYASVTKMRRARKELEKDRKWKGRIARGEWVSWRSVLAAMHGWAPKDATAEQNDQAIEAMERRLARMLGQKAHRKADVLGSALVRLDPNLARKVRDSVSQALEMTE